MKCIFNHCSNICFLFWQIAYMDGLWAASECSVCTFTRIRACACVSSFVSPMSIGNGVRRLGCHIPMRTWTTHSTFESLSDNAHPDPTSFRKIRHSPVDIWTWTSNFRVTGEQKYQPKYLWDAEGTAVQRSDATYALLTAKASQTLLLTLAWSGLTHICK